MSKASFFTEHHESENTRRHVWFLTYLVVAGAAALTLITFGFILG